MSERPTNELGVFAGSGSGRLVHAITDLLHIEPGRSESIRYSDDNTLVRILENVRGKDVFIVQTLSRPVNARFMELVFWIDAFHRASAREVTAVIPYFSYAKGDKKDEPRVSIRARACADCLEAVGVDRVLTMDLHAPQIQGFFRVPVDHLYAASDLIKQVKAREGPDNWVVVSPDAGYAKMARTHARLLGAPFALAEKIRTDHLGKPQIQYIIGEVKGRRALIVDDFTTTGGTLIAAAQRLLEKGVTEVYAAVSHGPLSPDSCETIAQSPLRRLFITDTVEHDSGDLPQNVTVVSVAALFARAIHSIFNRTSVSGLFPEQGS